MFTRILGDAIRAWDSASAPGVPHFAKLPSGWQTVWLARFYQEGPATHVTLGKAFRRQARDGDWAGAIATLKSYSEYTGRATAEAALLEVELPPSLLKRGSNKRRHFFIALALFTLTTKPESASTHVKTRDFAHSGSTTKLHGQWQVGPVIDPSKQPLPIDLLAQLIRARLPSPGVVVRSAKGELCVGSLPCDDITWTKIPFGYSGFGDGLRKDLDLSAQTPVYQGDIGNPSISYTLFARSDHTLMALISLCQDSYRAQGGRAAFEICQPVSRAAQVRTP